MTNTDFVKLVFINVTHLHPNQKFLSMALSYFVCGSTLRVGSKTCL
jgi:hypothetical protein